MARLCRVFSTCLAPSFAHPHATLRPHPFGWPVPDAERVQALPPLLENGWSESDERDAITKRFTFRNFRAAFAWMTQIALWAEKLDHHPEWTNTYRHVDVTLTTHSAEGLTILDLELATQMDAAAG